MHLQTVTETGRRWKASELRKLPPEPQAAILEAAAAQAEADYRNDPELTDFEAFGKDDLHGNSASIRPLLAPKPPPPPALHRAAP